MSNIDYMASNKSFASHRRRYGTLYKPYDNPKKWIIFFWQKYRVFFIISKITKTKCLFKYLLRYFHYFLINRESFDYKLGLFNSKNLYKKSLNTYIKEIDIFVDKTSSKSRLIASGRFGSTRIAKTFESIPKVGIDNSDWIVDLKSKINSKNRLESPRVLD